MNEARLGQPTAIKIGEHESEVAGFAHGPDGCSYGSPILLVLDRVGPRGQLALQKRAHFLLKGEVRGVEQRIVDQGSSGRSALQTVALWCGSVMITAPG